MRPSILLQRSAQLRIMPAMLRSPSIQELLYLPLKNWDWERHTPPSGGAACPKMPNSASLAPRSLLLLLVGSSTTCASHAASLPGRH